MKKQFFLLPLLAAMAMTACTSDDDLLLDEPAATPENGNGSVPYGYVAVNIAQAGSTGSRANNDTGFEFGTDEENLAEKGLFFIFKGDVRFGSAQDIVLKPAEETTGTGSTNVERIYNAVLVIDGGDAYTDDTKPTNLSIVCILNAPDETSVPEGQKKLRECETLSDLRAKVADYGITDAGKFIMTNSVYANDDNIVVGAPVLADNITTSASAALANPVNVYVERVVSKINMKKGATFENAGATEIIDGEEKTFNIEINGIEIANIARQSYLFKNINDFSSWKKPGTTQDFGDWWNDNAQNRSYWENMPTIDDTKRNGENGFYANKSWDDIDTGLEIDNLGTTGTDIYVQPNTDQTQKTAVLVAATLKNTDNTVADFVYLKGGYFATKKALDFIAQAVANSGYYKKATTQDKDKYEQLDADDFDWINKINNKIISWIESYEVVATVKAETIAGNKFYKRTGDTYTEVEVSAINEFLQGTPERTETDGTVTAAKRSDYTARYYKDGKCYYFVNIDQSPVAGATAHTYDGVVRNHYYKLTLKGIGGLGTPVFDPKDVIIPETPEGEEHSYLAATVQVLSWKFVTQGVTFGTVTE